jgi:hypothetical protein
MKNGLSDLNDHLFAQIERLSNEELSPEKIEAEVKRGNTIVAVADQIIRNAGLTLRAAELVAKHGNAVRPHLPMLQNKPAALGNGNGQG